MLFSVVKPNNYQDSLRLMRLSAALEDIAGVSQVSVMMGIEMNKDYLRRAELADHTVESAGPNDLLIVAQVEDTTAGEALAAMVDTQLSEQVVQAGRSRLQSVRSLDRALGLLPDANLAIVSIPGQYATRETERLLDRGFNVLIFSDNVSLDDEVALKDRARERGLLVMGPDCGTANIGGVSLGFANAVPAGNIGLVGASGTGLQEITVQIDRLGGGVSHAIGLGGRDLSARVGGTTCLRALSALDADPATDAVVLVSKPPAPQVRDQVIAAAHRLSKPVIALLLGEIAAQTQSESANDNIFYASSLEDAARASVEVAGTRDSRRVRLSKDQRWIKGLYAGGTLAAEAAMLLRGPLHLADPLEHRPGYLVDAGGHQVIDLGDDAYTRGRPHPMIDPSLRNDHVAAAFDDPENAVLVLDVMLGYGAHPDPAGALAPVIVEGLARAHGDGRDLAVVASVCGTEHDPQVLSAQTRTLKDAGVTVMPSNAAAVRHALSLVRGLEARPTLARGDTERLGNLLEGQPRIINIGLRGFAEAILDQGARVVQYDWKPIAGGDPRLQSLLEALR